MASGDPEIFEIKDECRWLEVSRIGWVSVQTISVEK